MIKPPVKVMAVIGAAFMLFGCMDIEDGTRPNAGSNTKCRMTTGSASQCIMLGDITDSTYEITNLCDQALTVEWCVYFWKGQLEGDCGLSEGFIGSMGPKQAIAHGVNNSEKLGIGIKYCAEPR